MFIHLFIYLDCKPELKWSLMRLPLSGKRGFTLRTVHENPEVDQFIQLFIEQVILGQVKKKN